MGLVFKTHLPCGLVITRDYPRHRNRSFSASFAQHRRSDCSNRAQFGRTKPSLRVGHAIPLTGPTRWSDLNARAVGKGRLLGQNRKQPISTELPLSAESGHRGDRNRTEGCFVRPGAALRLQTRSYPPGYDGGENYGCGEVVGELVVAGGDATPVLQSAEHPFDQGAQLVGLWIERMKMLAGRVIGNDRAGTALDQK
jgi:hypothetical protein